MPASDLLIAFFTAAAIFAFMPGPGILYAAAQAMAGGRTAGLLGTLGLALGGYLHVIAAAACGCDRATRASRRTGSPASGSSSRRFRRTWQAPIAAREGKPS